MNTVVTEDHVRAAYAARKQVIESDNIEDMEDAFVTVALLAGLLITSMASNEDERAALLRIFSTATKNAMKIMCTEEDLQ